MYIDRHLYKVMEEAIKSKDATEVKDALLKMVHELMTAVGIISLSRILLLLGIALIKLFCRVTDLVRGHLKLHLTTKQSDVSASCKTRAG